jgi:hypothetical protein
VPGILQGRREAGRHLYFVACGKAVHRQLPAFSGTGNRAGCRGQSTKGDSMNENIPPCCFVCDHHRDGVCLLKRMAVRHDFLCLLFARKAEAAPPPTVEPMPAAPLIEPPPEIRPAVAVELSDPPQSPVARLRRLQAVRQTVVNINQEREN